MPSPKATAQKVWEYVRWNCRDLDAERHEKVVMTMLAPIVDQVAELKKENSRLQQQVESLSNKLLAAEKKVIKAITEKNELTAKHVGAQNKISNLKAQLKRRGIKVE